MMMSRRLMACTAGAILCASFAFADGQKFAQLQPYLDGVQLVQPLQACKVRLINGQVVQVSPWIDLSQFNPASGLPPSPCAAGGNLAFDNVEMNANGQLCENTKYGAACDFNSDGQPDCPQSLLVVRQHLSQPLLGERYPAAGVGHGGEPSHGRGACLVRDEY
jgi:hypothetical protein